jgi:hypothetical protein
MSRVLAEIMAAVERRAHAAPPTTRKRDMVKGWLHNIGKDVTRLSADKEEVETLQRELEKMVTEFQVRVIDGGSCSF